jgi:hypothetical protein
VIIERRCVILGLHTPQTAVVEIVKAQAPREMSTDRIEAALNALLADQCGGGEKPLLGLRLRVFWPPRASFASKSKPRVLRTFLRVVARWPRVVVRNAEAQASLADHHAGRRA